LHLFTKYTISEFNRLLAKDPVQHIASPHPNTDQDEGIKYYDQKAQV